MGMPGYFDIEIKSVLKNETYTRSIKFLGGCGLNWLTASYTFNKDELYQYDSELTEEDIKKSDELDRKFFAKIITETEHLLDGKYKVVYDSSKEGYKYTLYDDEKHL